MGIIRIVLIIITIVAIANDMIDTRERMLSDYMASIYLILLLIFLLAK